MIKKTSGYVMLIGGWVVLSFVFQPMLMTREWFISVAAASMFAMSGSLITASVLNKWPWDIE